VLLHHLQKLDDDLGTRADEHLSLSALLGVVDCLQAISQHTHAHHLVLLGLNKYTKTDINYTLGISRRNVLVDGQIIIKFAPFLSDVDIDARHF
jgi:hypothetical protein